MDEYRSVEGTDLEVSRDGRFRLARARGNNRPAGSEVVPHPGSDGRPMVTTVPDSGHTSTRSAAVLILLAWGPPRPTPRAVAATVGGDPWDLHVDNLVWDKPRGRGRGTPRAAVRRRPCNCCRKPFRPESRFNLLCEPCARRGDQLPDGFEYVYADGAEIDDVILVNPRGDRDDSAPTRPATSFWSKKKTNKTGVQPNPSRDAALALEGEHDG